MKRSNQLSKGGAAGGPGSRALTPKVTTYFGGQPSQRVNPGGADQLGQAMSNHVTGDMGGRRTKLPNPATPMTPAKCPVLARPNWEMRWRSTSVGAALGLVEPFTASPECRVSTDQWQAAPNPRVVKSCGSSARIARSSVRGNSHEQQ